MKKILLTSIAALSMIMVSAQAEAPKCGQGKCGAGMMKQGKQKMHKKGGMHSPFLIKHGLPHYTKMLMKHWDDPQLGLSEEQKSKLLTVRKETISSIKSLKPQIKQLTQEIVKAAKEGVKADSLKPKVEKLAALESEATMTHLKCIEKTKAVLSPKQLEYLMAQKKQKRMQKMQKMKEKMPMGKCGGNK